MIKKTLLATALMAATSTAALAEISGNVAMSSDYVWRGVSQTDNQMAISGGLDYSHASGLYVGTWASNVSSDFFGGAVDPQIELDFYGGYGGEMGAISYDLGVIGYNYPGASEWNTLEVYAGGGYKFTDTVSGNAKYSYSSDFFDTGDSAWRLEAAVDVSLPMDFGLSMGIATNDGDAFSPSTLGIDSYMDYKVGLSKSVAGVDLGLTYTDTDLSESECFGGYNVCDSKIVFSVAKSL
jgi:uncharacterized protein (TIGR02001 family)